VNPEPIRLETPLRLEDVELLKSGDVVRLYGVLYAARDAAHARMKEVVDKGGRCRSTLRGR
jgi:fumarate hydratase subunit beta